MKNKDFIKIVVVVLFSCFFLLWFFNNHIEEQEQRKMELKIDTYLKELNDIETKTKKLVMTSSVFLSKNDNVKRCLKTKNKEACSEYLTKIKQSLLDTDAFEDFKIHLHSKDLKSFYRLWDTKTTNDSLSGFRHSLKIVKELKKSISCIEVGRYSMLIRGISPIFEDNKYLGTVENISNFEPIIKYFKQKGIKLYVLMNKENQNIASKVHFSKNQILTDYVVLNQISKFNNFVLVHTPIYNISKKVIGYYVFQIFYE